MSEQDKQDIRMECLRLAAQHGHISNAVEYAAAFADFVLGANDAEVIRAARELAAKVKGE